MDAVNAMRIDSKICVSEGLSGVTETPVLELPRAIGKSQSSGIGELTITKIDRLFRVVAFATYSILRSALVGVMTYFD